MKKTILIILFSVIASSIMAEYTINDPYEFPIQRGSDEWFKLKRERRIYETYQIPEDILTAMTTKAIIKTFIGGRFTRYSLMYDDIEGCFNNVCKKVNMYEEMTNRKDYKAELLSMYMELCNTKKPFPDSLNQDGIHKSTYLFTELYSVEMLLNQSILIEQLSKEEELELLSIIYDRIISNTEGGYGFSVPKMGVYFLAHSLLSGNKGYQNEYDNRSIPNSLWTQVEEGQIIIKKYIISVLQGER